MKNEEYIYNEKRIYIRYIYNEKYIYLYIVET